jgi:DNA-binding Lrp family transcriptional regulator
MIAKGTGLANGTVHNKMSKLEQGGVIEKTDAIIRIAEVDLKHIEGIQSLEDAHIQEFNSQANGGKFLSAGDLKQLSTIGEMKNKRRAMLLGENTNSEGGEIQVINYADTV